MDVMELLRSVTNVLVTAIEVVGVVVITVAILRATRRYGLALLRRERPFPPEPLRIELGRSLALALEFLLAADILRTAIQPTWDAIAQLAAIAGIRVVLNFFLDRELSEEQRRMRHLRDSSADGSDDTERGDAASRTADCRGRCEG